MNGAYVQSECGFCIDGRFTLRARGGQPARKIKCPYCGGSGLTNTIDLAPHDGGSES